MCLGESEGEEGCGNGVAVGAKEEYVVSRRRC
jgi:hypothetical protein